MFINPISITNNQTQPTSFKNLAKTKIERNKLKILLTQDIWAPKLKVKMPESPLEKEVILEILKQRLKLDRFAQLSNEKFVTKGDIIIYNELAETEPDSERCKTLREKIEKKGHLGKYFNNINREINIETKNNKDAMTYFNNIANIEDIYLERKFVTENKMNHYFAQINKNNINKDGNYSTEELIEIIERGENPTTAERLSDSERVLTKKQLITRFENEYEPSLRTNFNLYNRPFNPEKEIAIIKGNLEKKYINSLVKYPEVGKTVSKIFKKIEKEFLHKVYQVATIQIYSLSTGWENIQKIEKAIKGTNIEINVLKAKLETDSKNEKLKLALSQKEKIVEDLKYNWGKWLEFCVEYEKVNRQRMADAGKEEIYDYLTAENKTIKAHEALYKTFQENNGKMPESYWTN